MREIGVRELRQQLATVIRQAGDGETVVIAVHGRPVAQLGPLGGQGVGVSLDDLFASGLAEPPRRTDRPDTPPAIDVAVDVRPSRILDDLRGR